MKLRGMYCLSPMEMAHRLGQRAQAAHGFAITWGECALA